jgi:aspartate racemase
MTQHIGIVACSAEGASLCYPLSDYTACLERGDLAGVGALMLASAHKLAKLGAEFLICPDNTIHQAFAYVQPRSPLPWLHIAEVVAAEAAGRGFRRLALTGTKWLVESDVYPEKLAAHGLACERPDRSDREEINRIIMDELVHGIFKPDSLSHLQQTIERLKQAGCDAAVLGCTEIPLIIDDTNSPLPTLDSTRLLARAALRRACASERRFDWPASGRGAVSA